MKKSKTVISGPIKAPKLSPNPSSPKALPLCCSTTEEATSASLGAERVPAPSLSENLAAKTNCHEDAIPINGFETAERMYPKSVIGFLR